MAKKKKKEEKEETAEVNVEESTGTEAQEEVSAEPEVVVEESPEAQLQKELEIAREEANKNHEIYLRAMADMENLRKRSQREKDDLAKFGNENILREILPVIDNLERAVEHAVQDEATNGLLEGVKMTLDQFGKVLEKFNVVQIEAVGQVFDSALHQAMGQVETDEVEPNMVAQEMQKGYLLNERLLRPSLVMVAKAPAEQQEENAQDKEAE